MHVNINFCLRYFDTRLLSKSVGTVIDMMFIKIHVYLQESVCFIYFKMVLFRHTTNKEKFRKQLVNHSWVVVMGGALI